MSNAILICLIAFVGGAACIPLALLVAKILDVDEVAAPLTVGSIFSVITYIIIIIMCAR